MKKLNVIAQKINQFNKVNDSLIGKHVLVKHSKYPEIQDVVRNVKKMPGINTKQVCFEDANPILIREGDRFDVEILGFKSNKVAQGRNIALHEKIFDFFRSNPRPKDSEVHAFSKTLGIDEHQFEEEIYNIIGSFIGYGDSVNFRGVINPEQLKIGIEEEMEHTNHPLIARKIASDHIAKISTYYTWLKKMEGAAKKAISKLMEKLGK